MAKRSVHDRLKELDEKRKKLELQIEIDKKREELRKLKGKK